MELRTLNLASETEMTSNSKEPQFSNVKKLKTKKTKTTEIKSIHKDHRSRLKSQFLENGIDGLTDIQKLELLLFYSIPLKDTNPLAHSLLKKFGSLSGVLTANYHELIQVEGIKENSATLIKFFSSMLNYGGRTEHDEILGSSGKTKKYVSKYFNHVAVEQFYVFCLTKTNSVKKSFLINSGTASEVDVQIRDITRHAFETNCNRIIIAHNHPDGIASMSPQDCKFTYSLICSCVLNNIEVLDHIIVGTDTTISLYEQGYLAAIKAKVAENIQIKDRDLFMSEESSNYIKSKIDIPKNNNISI